MPERRGCMAKNPLLERSRSLHCKSQISVCVGGCLRPEGFLIVFSGYMATEFGGGKACPGPTNLSGAFRRRLARGLPGANLSALRGLPQPFQGLPGPFKGPPRPLRGRDCSLATSQGCGWQALQLSRACHGLAGRSTRPPTHRMRGVAGGFRV